MGGVNGHDHALAGFATYGAALVVGSSRFGLVLPGASTIGLGAAVAVGAALAADIDEKHSVASQGAGVFGGAARLVTGAFGGHRTVTHFPLVWLAVLSGLSAGLISGRFGPVALGVVLGVFVALGFPFLVGPVRRSRLGPLLDVLTVLVAVSTFVAVDRFSVTAGWWLFAAIPVPYLSHMVADTPTPAGVPWLFPLSRRTFGLGLFHSGGRFESTVVSPLLAAAGIWMVWKLIGLGAFG